MPEYGASAKIDCILFHRLFKSFKVLLLVKLRTMHKTQPPMNDEWGGGPMSSRDGGVHCEINEICISPLNFKDFITFDALPGT